MIEEIAERAAVGERRREGKTRAEASLQPRLHRIVVGASIGCDLLEVCVRESVLRIRKDHGAGAEDDALVQVPEFAAVARQVADVLDADDHAGSELVLRTDTELLHPGRRLVRVLNAPLHLGLVDIGGRHRREAVAQNHGRGIGA